MFLKLDWGIIWPIVNIVVFYLLLRKFLFGPVSEIMEKRKKMISSDLNEAAQYVNVKNGYKKNIKACIFYQSYSIQLYEKDLFFDDKITTGKVKIPIGIVFIVSKDMKSNK